MDSAYELEMQHPALAPAVLKLCATACVLMTFGEVADRTRPRRRKRIFFSLLDLAYVICNMASCFLSAWQGYVSVRLMSAQASLSILNLINILALCAQNISLIIAVVASVWLRYLSAGTSFLIWGAHCLHLVALVTELVSAKQLAKERYNPAFAHEVATKVLLIAMVSGSCLYSGLQDAPARKKLLMKTACDQNEDTHSVLRRLVCAAVFRHIWNAAYHAKVVRTDLPVLGEALRCRPQMNKLRKLLSARSKELQPGPFIFRVLCVLRQDLLWCMAANFAYYTSLLIRIPLLEELLRPEAAPHKAFTSLIVLLIASCVAEFVLVCVEAEHSHNFGVRTNSLCQAAVFTKMLRMSPAALSAYPASRLVSVMAVDSTRLSVAASAVPRVLVGLLCTPFVHYALSVRAGVLPVLCCVAWQVLTFLLLAPQAKLQRRLWARVMKSHDVRLEKTTDLLSSVRLVKLYAWEDTFADLISTLRGREVKEQFVANLADGFVDSLFVSCSGLMTIVLFGTRAGFYPDQPLTASISFSCLYAISLLDPAHMNTVPVLRHVVLSVLGLKRIAKACTEEEMETATGAPSSADSSKQGSVRLENCAFSWNRYSGRDAECTNVVLRDVNLRVEAGSMVGVTGFVGSGKSALLAAIQGEIHRVGGSVSVGGSVAFVPQSACIYNMSIRNNILFGKPLDLARYKSVLDACDLLEDVARFPSKDLTEVGERGAALSGGQKQRISLARAVYSDSDLYLLDDTLSALDVHVASKVFERVIAKRGILCNKTRLVVCNQARYLEKMDRILLVADRRVTPFESFAQLLKDPKCPNMLKSDIDSENTASQGYARKHLLNQADEAPANLTSQDDVEMSKTNGMELFLSMLRIAGPSIALAFTSFLLRAASIGAYLVLIKQWTDASAVDGCALYWIIGLAALCLSDVFFGCVGSAFLALSIRNLTGQLHERMLRRVLGSPVLFFDTTPRGRVLTRFTADLDSVDSRLFLASKQLVQTLTAGVARVVVSGLQVHAAGLLAAIATAAFLFSTGMLAKASNAARRLESIEYSRLLQHVTETRDSLSVIRSYGAEGSFVRHGYRLLDAATRAMLALLDCVRSIRFAGGLCGFIAVLASAAFVLQASTNSPSAASHASAVGLTLSSSMGIPLLITGAIAGVVVFFQIMVSFERCLEYTRLPAEADTWAAQAPVTGAQGKGPLPMLTSCTCRPLGAEWPAQGRVQFHNYTASYRPGASPNVLTDVSFLVKPREKVGIVGRTGAGKSSLIMALLRVLHASAGTIRIDDVDIASVPLRKLRSVITVIPQDPSLTRGPLRDVLDPARSHSDEDVRRVLEQVHLQEFVASHPENIRLEVGDSGSNLSAGQRQLVCLARALLRRPRVLLLDEATSSLDGDADRLIQRTLRQSFTQCTVLTVAHRLDTVLDYDKILVMHGGRVVEFGHTSALACDERSAFYAMLQRAGLTQADAAGLGSERSKRLSTRV